MNSESNQKESHKLYSQQAISIATYLGGPMAAGILARQNFINLGNEQLGKKSFLIGIVSTIFLYVGIYSAPAEIMEKIPNALIPLVYTIIIYFVIEKSQGSDLKEHKENNKPFYSGWKATGIGVVCMIIQLGGIFGYTLISPEDFDTKKYDNGIAEFNKNEEKALQLFSMIESSRPYELIEFIDNVGLPAWQENIEIINDLDTIEGLYDEFRKQNEVLKQYSELRIETFQLIKLTIEEDTDKYQREIEELGRKLEEIMQQL